MSLVTKKYFHTEYEVIASFIDDMIQHGIYPSENETIIADGQVQRFRVKNDKPGSKNGWYVLYLSDLPAGAYGSWKETTKFNWSYKPVGQLSKKEQSEYFKKIKKLHEQAKAKKRASHMEAAARANKIWSSTSSAQAHHPYLKRKRIYPYCARQLGSKLVLPIVDFNKQILSLQFIDPLGNKRLLKSGEKVGHFIPIQLLEKDAAIYICEGFSTGATIAQETPEASVIAAIDAGNLKSVAMQACKDFPSTKLYICADDDRLRDDNPGLTKAREAAIYSGAELIIPVWPEDAPSNLSDFNDLASYLGINEVLV